MAEKLEKHMVEQPNAPSLAVAAYKPPGTGPLPTIIMGHGLGTVKEDGLSAFRNAFLKAGYAIINFDYATWGESEGTPRHVIIVWNEYRDFCSVVRWVRSRPAEFDAGRLVVWGSSFGGMHTTRLMAEDKELRAGIAQCPCVDAQAASWMKPVLVSLRIGFWGVVDTVGSYLGFSPVYLTNAQKPASNELALMMGEDVAGKWAKIAVQHTTDLDVDNKVAARSLLSFPFSRPIAKAREITAPYLVVLPEWDSVAPLELAEQVAKLAQKGESVKVAGGHFDLYEGGVGYEKNLAAQLEFLSRVCPV